MYNSAIEPSEIKMW